MLFPFFKCKLKHYIQIAKFLRIFVHKIGENTEKYVVQNGYYLKKTSVRDKSDF